MVDFKGNENYVKNQRVQRGKLKISKPKLVDSCELVVILKQLPLVQNL